MGRLPSNLGILEAQESDPSLDALRVRVYAIAFPIGVLTLVLVYILDFVQGTSTPFQLLILPLIATTLIVSALIVARAPQHLRKLERVWFVIVSLFLALRFYSIVYQTAMQGNGSMFTTFLQWLPMIYFLAFLMFRTRQALFASVVFYLLLLIPTLVIVLRFGMRSFEVFDVSTLIQIHLSHAVYIPVLSGIALLKAEYVRAAARADALAAIATVDYLTGAANRRQSEQQLSQMIDRAQRYEHKLSLLLLDIDTFKLINDAHGHSTGDLVLIRLVELLHEHLRASDVCGRWGGEEFIIIAPETPLDQAVLLADRLRTIIAAESIELIGRFTVSFGVAELKPGEGSHEFVKRADHALYRAKQNGRNRVEHN